MQKKELLRSSKNENQNGKINNDKTYANPHLLADNKLNTKPFDVHLIKDKIINTIKIKSKIIIIQKAF